MLGLQTLLFGGFLFEHVSAHLELLPYHVFLFLFLSPDLLSARDLVVMQVNLIL